LRVVTRAENGQNLPAGRGSSPHRGVTFRAAEGRWVAQARLNYRCVTLGRFPTEAEAAAAASAFRREHMPMATD
jgi:hypothetical protein